MSLAIQFLAPVDSGDVDRPDFRVRLLGVPRIERREGEQYCELRWDLKRALRLLAFLASSPGMAAAREDLMEVAWPEADRVTIGRNFHPTVSHLRRTLAPEGHPRGALVRVRQGVYSLEPSLHWEIDTVAFEAAVARGLEARQAGRLKAAAGEWTTAWELYGGSFCHGHDDPWILERRDRLERMYHEVLKDLSEVQIELGNSTEAEDALRTLVLQDPLEEGLYVRLMEVYARRGRHDLMHRQYERMRAVLRDELGVDPSRASAEAYNRLLVPAK